MSDVATDLTTSSGLAEHLDDVQVVDCREAVRVAGGPDRGLDPHPPEHDPRGRDRPARSAKTTVVVCRSGNRSELATLMLRARGFDAYNLEHGLEEWADQGRPLTTPDGAAGHVA